MRASGIFVVVITVFLLLDVDHVEAGWKFWKKKDKDASTTTVAPDGSDPEASKVTPVAVNTPAPINTPAPANSATPINTNRAITGAADPGLVIGVGNTGSNIKNNAQPLRPNPGTEVGLDIPGSKPARPGVGGSDSQGYRNWAADITGAGEPGKQQPPRLPAQGPALTSGGQQPPTQGSGSSSLPASPRGQPQSPNPRPASLPANTPVQPQTPGSRPGSPTSNVPQPSNSGQGPRPGSPTAGNVPVQQPGQSTPRPSPQPSPNASPVDHSTGGRPQTSTLHIGTLKPFGATTPSPRPDQGRPGSPNSPGERSWAEIAGGGSRPGSPTPSPRPTGVQPPSSGQSLSGPQTPVQPGRTRPSAGTIAAGGAAAGAALAGGAVAGTAAGSGQPGGATSNTVPSSSSGGSNKVYSSNPTYSKGNTVTDEDLEKLSEALFIMDTSNANRFITLNLQKQTTSSSPTDEAPQPLFNVRSEAYEIPTIQKVLTIYDNYNLDTRTSEYINPAQRQEESLLVDTFLSTNVMSAAMRFLANKGYIRKDYYDYKDTLRRMWFNLFSRGEGKIGSTGFEHVFMTELKSTPSNTEVLGLHNWIYYAKEEAKGKADYLGYIKKLDLGNKASLIKIHTKFDGHNKPVTTMFVGTSPELEMSLYTVCFIVRPEQACPVSLGGTKFNIATHKFKYRGNDLVGSAFPDI